MTHNEKRAHWVKEGAIGLGTGILFGFTNVVVGHVRFFLIQFLIIVYNKMYWKYLKLKPFDTIKTKMQSQKGYENLGMIKSFKTVFVKDGFRGLYR